MKNVLAALKLLAGEVSHLSARNITAIAGVAAPLIAAALGLNITAAELGAYMTVLVTVCGIVAKLDAAKQPAPPAK